MRRADIWPEMKQEITQLVECWEICQSYAQSQKWPPIQQPEMPPHTWHTFASDLFYLNKQNYIIVAEYFSKCPVVRKSEIFTEWGPPHIIKTDNGTQYVYKEFLEFLASHKVRLITSSPDHQQSNGLAKTYIKYAKNLIIKALEAGKPWFHVPQEYTNSPQPIFTSRSKNMPEAQYQPSSIASSQWQFHWVQWSSDAMTGMTSFTLQVRTTDSCILFRTTCMCPESRKSKWEPGTVTQSSGEPSSYQIQLQDGSALCRMKLHLKPRYPASNPG